MDFARPSTISFGGANARASWMITFEPIRIAVTSGHDSKGMLVHRSGSLVAVIVQLDDEGLEDPYVGKWHFEATFGCLPSTVRQVFSDLEEVRRWIAQHTVETPLLRGANPTFG